MPLSERLRPLPVQNGFIASSSAVEAMLRLVYGSGSYAIRALVHPAGMELMPSGRCC